MQPKQLVTQGIQVSVLQEYKEHLSTPETSKFIYAYHITIENVGESTMQLLRRHWFKQDSLGPIREVEGPGVVGQTPILKPGDKFNYDSWTEMETTIGRMYGFFTFQKNPSNELVEVAIPSFELVTSFKSN